jgi:hypothetical protein
MPVQERVHHRGHAGRRFLLRIVTRIAAQGNFGIRRLVAVVLNIIRS